MRNCDLPIARSLPLFSNISEQHFDAVIKGARLQSFTTHVDLISEGDKADFLYVLLEGQVELFTHLNGRESSIRLIEPMASFVLATVAIDSTHQLSARTFSRAKILLIPVDVVRKAFRKDTNFAGAIVTEMAQDYQSMVKLLTDVKLRTGVERLSNILLGFHKAQGGRGVVKLPCDKRTLASLLGMSAENLSRTFNTLKAYNVEVVGSEVYLNDINALTQLASAH